jgi:hypothetical protein
VPHTVTVYSGATSTGAGMFRLALNPLNDNSFLSHCALEPALEGTAPLDYWTLSRNFLQLRPRVLTMLP